MNKLSMIAISLSVAATVATPAAGHDSGSRPPFPLVPDPGTDYSRNDYCDFAPFACAADLVARDRTRAALPLLERAAVRGSRPAVRAIGLIYLRGEGDTGQDVGKALRWFREGARRGDAESMYVLGISFRRGLGVEADQALARQWLQRAAEAGYAPARTALTTF